MRKYSFPVSVKYNGDEFVMHTMAYTYADAMDNVRYRVCKMLDIGKLKFRIPEKKLKYSVAKHNIVVCNEDAL